MAKLKNKILKQSGITSDNKKVISGCYELYKTHGIPLDVLFTYLSEKNCVPDFVELYRDAKKEGMSHERIISKLEESISDSLGSEWSGEVILRLNKIFGEPNDKT